MDDQWNQMPASCRIRHRLAFLLLAVALILVLQGCSESIFKAGINWERQRAGLTEASIKARDLHFSYLDGGRGNIVLLVHGFGSNKDSWNRFARHLSSKYRVVAVDLPGHGESASGLEYNYGIPSQARRLALFTEALGIDRFHILGSSMGGAIAIYFSHEHPDRIITLGLMSAAGVLSPRPSEYMQKLEKGENPLLVRSREDFDAMLEFVMAQPPYMPWFVRNVAYEQYRKRQAINQKIFNDIATGEVTEVPFLPEINMPVFILWGEKDRVLDVSSVEVFEKRIPRTEIVILDGIGHAPMYEAPEISAKHYLAFLQQN